ncbi:DNA-directed RNA polymerase I subunit RPA2 isoform X3 [Echeneis naucrates]|uniref:DNA-directed RNA polymerase I subunit RPA2 isoform X3 n=1 Tax=Echeneis naucrates TaxID=173247 RepID=UPI001113E6C6|nr:DNA-directed RNA polymerase I subunit RPA2 isoform X3 [Echeneis naucrates]
MDHSTKWSNLPKAPSLKNLTHGRFGDLKPDQHAAVQDLTKAHIESFDQAVTDGLSRVVQAIPPLEFMVKNDKITLSFVEATIQQPSVAKGNICRELRVFPAECRGRRCSYKGKLVVDISWLVNGVPKGIIKQSLGQVPIMVKSKLCNLHGMSPKELVEHHEEAEEMGGYFIVNGIEKVIRMLIMPRRNYPIAMARPKWKSRGQGYTQYGISIHCVKEEHTAINMNLHYLENGTVMLNFIYQKELFFLPLGFVLKALVDFTDFQIYQELIKGREDNSFYKSCVSEMLRIVSEEGCTTRSKVLNYLGERFRVKMNLPEWYTNEQCANFLLHECVCIHLKSDAEKFYLLCLMTRKLFTFAKQECMEENPDSIMCQEVLTPGQLYLMFLKVSQPVTETIYKVLKEKKIPPWTEIVLVPKTGKASLYPGLFLFTTPCRMVRPVRNLALGKEELVGTFEQLYINVGILEDDIEPGVSTHQELFPHSMLSVVANFIPYSDHNQSPRNMYQCQMGKQTMGFPLHSFMERSDNKLYRLQTPQSPLVRPYMYDHYNLDNYPSGTNAVVAVISYTGYDMEDAMIVNKSSWERGFAHGSIYKTELVDLAVKMKGEDSVVFGTKPGEVSARLDADGLPHIGSTLRYGDPFYSCINLNTGQTYVTYYRSQEECVVDNIKICSNDSGSGHFKRICITIRVPRNPTIGDKFASRHGQKGILSRLWPAEDMPFTESGMSPDILFNPHGFPSRMTIGMLIESMAGKSGALHGLSHDATPFTFSEENSALEHFGEMLKAGGYNYYGTERLYSGVSGQELEADIFIGIVYYQRLRHMVSDKFQVRTTGARDKVTNQPVGGRNIQGGIRFGEMERDALLAHGSSFLLHDRLFNCSDRSVAQVCVDCGSLLSPLLEKPPPYWSAMRHRKTVCTLCGKSDSIDSVSVPYVFRYFVAELAAMNIKVKLDIK